MKEYHDHFVKCYQDVFHEYRGTVMVLSKHAWQGSYFSTTLMVPNNVGIGGIVEFRTDGKPSFVEDSGSLHFHGPSGQNWPTIDHVPWDHMEMGVTEILFPVFHAEFARLATPMLKEAGVEAVVSVDGDYSKRRSTRFHVWNEQVGHHQLVFATCRGWTNPPSLLWMKSDGLPNPVMQFEDEYCFMKPSQMRIKDLPLWLNETIQKIRG